eukprot:310582-Pelagomonas_calceolata.AAC.1
MDSSLHILSGQCPVIRYMVTERHNIASRMILKEISEGSYGSNLIQMYVGSPDRQAQHDLHITEQVRLRESLTVLYLHTSFTPVFVVKLDAPPAAPMLSWSFLPLLTQIGHLLPHHIKNSAV